MSGRFLLSVAILQIAAATALARPVSPAEAALTASAAGAAHRGAGMSALRTAAAVSLVWTGQSAATAGVADYYAFDVNGGGWVLVAGDDAAPPVLARSDTGNFDVGNMPPAMRSLLDSYSRQMEIIRQHPEAARVVVTAADVEVTPLLTTKWNQTAPYNDNCPTHKSGGTTYRAVTGCGATAMTQVMNYYQWPVTGSGSRTYQCNVNGSATATTLSADFAAATYDWANMANTYTTSSAAAKKKAVAKLMSDAGVSVGMEYGASSSSYLNAIASALVSYFGYDAHINAIDRPEDDYADFEQSLRDELNALRPVIYRGHGASNEGHIFVLDGYMYDGQFHVNWGWGGAGDGYFLLSLLSPTINGSKYDFTIGQVAITGIQPSYSWQYPMVTGFCQDLSSINTRVSKSSAFRVKVGHFWLYGEPDCKKINVGLMLLNEQETDTIATNWISQLTMPEENFVYPHYWTLTYGYFNEAQATRIAGNAPDGRYHLKLIWSPDNSDEVQSFYLPLEHKGYIPISVDGNVVTLGKTDEEVPEDDIIITEATDIDVTQFRANWQPNITNKPVASYSLKVAEAGRADATLALHETFAKCTQEGTSNIEGKLNNYADNKGWTGTYVYQHEEGLRFGTAGNVGNITSPTIDLTDRDPLLTVRFTAKAFGDDTPSAVIVSCGSAGSKTVALSDRMEEYEVMLDAKSATGQKVKFACTAKAKRVVVGSVDIYAGDARDVAAENALPGRAPVYLKTITGISDTTCLVSGLAPGETYSYQVRAVYTNGGMSDWSRAATVKLVNAVHARPSLDAATEVDLAQFRAHWNVGGLTEAPESYTLKVVDATMADTTLMIHETFAKCTQTVSGNIAGKLDSYADNKGWTGAYVFQHEQGVRVGSADNAGNITSPAINLTDRDPLLTVRFNAMGYENGNPVSVIVSCGTSSQTIALTDELTEHIVLLDAAAAKSQKVKFASTDKDKTFVLSDVDIYAGDARLLFDGARRAAKETGGETARTITGISDTTYLVAKLTPRHTFRYQVRAVYADGTMSPWSDPGEVKLVAANDPLPTMLPAAAIDSTRFTAQWRLDAPLKTVESYTLKVNSVDIAEPRVLLTETMSKCTKDVSGTVASSLNTYMENKGWTGQAVYVHPGVIQLGNSTQTGYITTPAMDLTGRDGLLTVEFEASPRDCDDAVLEISCGSDVKMIAIPDTATHVVTLDAAAAKSQKVKFATHNIAKRVCFHRIVIYSGDARARRNVGARRDASTIGDASSMTITGITEPQCEVEGLVLFGTYLYQVRAIYSDGSLGGWSVAEQVTLKKPLGCDINSDAVVDVGDVNAVLEAILAGSDNATLDVNGDGHVDVGDVNTILSAILTGP